MKTLVTKMIALVALSALAPSLALAHPTGPRKVLLGSTTLMKSTDADLINVKGLCPGPKNKPVVAIQIKVVNANAEIDHLALKYGNQAWDSIPLRERFYRGTTSRVIDLPFGARCVDAIFVKGDTDGPTKRNARVLVYGYR